MTIDTTGNVGIGTTSIHNPQNWNKVLDILGSAHARLNVRSTGGVVTSVFSHDNWNGSRGVMGTESNHPLTFATNNTHHMTIDTTGNVGIGTPSPGAMLDVAGIIKAKGYKTRIYNAGGIDSGQASLSDSNNWADFPDLSITFSLSEPAAVIAFYQITMFGNGSHLVSRIVVDGRVVSRTITGETWFWGNSGFWIDELSAGSHNIKIQYRTPEGGTNSPNSNDNHNRILRVMVLGS